MKRGWGRIAILFSVAFLFGVPAVFAQTQSPGDALISGSTIPLPQPVTDFIHTLDQIHIDQNLPILKDINNLAQNAASGGGIDTNFLSSVGGYWEKINSWLSAHIGISLSQIVRALGNFVVWVLGFVSNLIQTGLSHLSG